MCLRIGLVEYRNLFSCFRNLANGTIPYRFLNPGETIIEESTNLPRISTMTFHIGQSKKGIFYPAWPSRLGLQNTLTASLQRDKIPLTSVLEMK